jgi:hypothetical protein
VAGEGEHGVADRLDGRLVAGVECQDRRRHDLVAGEPIAVHSGRHERGEEIVTGAALPILDHGFDVVDETPGGFLGDDTLLLGARLVERAHHRVRPFDQLRLIFRGDTEQVGDHRQGNRRGVVGHDLHRAALACGLHRPSRHGIDTRSIRL